MLAVPSAAPGGHGFSGECWAGSLKKRELAGGSSAGAMLRFTAAAAWRYNHLDGLLPVLLLGPRRHGFEEPARRSWILLQDFPVGILPDYLAIAKRVEVTTLHLHLRSL